MAQRSVDWINADLGSMYSLPERCILEYGFARIFIYFSSVVESLEKILVKKVNLGGFHFSNESNLFKLISFFLAV